MVARLKQVSHDDLRALSAKLRHLDRLRDLSRRRPDQLDPLALLDALVDICEASRVLVRPTSREPAGETAHHERRSGASTSVRSRRLE